MTEPPPRSGREMALWWGLGAGLLVITLVGLISLLRSDAPPPQALGHVPEFSLTDQAGETVSPATLAGRVWVADFMFTRCRGICPILSDRFLELQRSWADVDGWRLVSFTVDPEHDTAEVLAAYAQELGADGEHWKFLTGEETELRRLVVEGFHLAVEPGQDSVEEPILHSQRLILVDGAGEIRGYYDALDRDSMTRLERDGRHLLKEAR